MIIKKRFILTSLTVAMMLSLNACQHDTQSTESTGATNEPTTTKKVSASDSPVTDHAEVEAAEEAAHDGDDAGSLGEAEGFPEPFWQLEPIPNSEVDPVYRREWAKSSSKDTCPIIALPTDSHANLKAHKARRANFTGGWGVAYDHPKLRSAYGVAHSGISEPLEGWSIWDAYHVYDDGTELTYGREGGDPNGKWLAYLTLGDSHCFYNIWSQYDQHHLERMLSSLRLVEP